MDTLLVNGDFQTDSFGHPVTVSGNQELLQRALIRLSVKRGAFAPDPSLGSRFDRLSAPYGKKLDEEALLYAREALMELPEVQVLSARVTAQEDGSSLIFVRVKAMGQVAELSSVSLPSEG